MKFTYTSILVLLFSLGIHTDELDGIYKCVSLANVETSFLSEGETVRDYYKWPTTTIQ